MPTPQEHALLSASAAARWLNCTAAPRFEAAFPEETSEYAEEGRVAHSLCELKLLKKFCSLPTRTYNARHKKIKEEKAYAPEMERTSDAYVDFAASLEIGFGCTPTVHAEVKVDLTEWIPEGFGTCDCVMIGGETLVIIDYKHGKGVTVSAEGNAQMRLYALGVLRRYAAVYGDAIKTVVMCIVQPRVTDTPSVEGLPTEQLLEWGESVKAPAMKAYYGFGEFVPGDHCRFCRGRSACRARAEKFLSLEADRTRIIPDEELGELIARGREVVAWYKGLTERATRALLAGKSIPGWKLVPGRSNRTFTDPEAAIKAAMQAGVKEAMLYHRVPVTLTELEKLMGHEAFESAISPYIHKPYGAPTLVPESDPRPLYCRAALDFAEMEVKTETK